MWDQVHGVQKIVAPIIANATDGVNLICFSQGVSVIIWILATFHSISSSLPSFPHSSLPSLSLPFLSSQEGCCVEGFYKPILITMSKPSFLSPVHKQDSLEVRYIQRLFRSHQNNCMNICNFQTQNTWSFYFQTSPKTTCTCEFVSSQCTWHCVYIMSCEKWHMTWNVAISHGYSLQLLLYWCGSRCISVRLLEWSAYCSYCTCPWFN